MILAKVAHMKKAFADNSEKTGEVRCFYTTPLPRLIPEITTRAHKAFIAIHEGMQTTWAYWLESDFIAPNETGVSAGILKRACVSTINQAVKIAGNEQDAVFRLRFLHMLFTAEVSYRLFEP